MILALQSRRQEFTAEDVAEAIGPSARLESISTVLSRFARRDLIRPIGKRADRYFMYR